MSLWSINDDETATLMGMFFDNLSEGGELMPHEALRNAILYYKKMSAIIPILGLPFQYSEYRIKKNQLRLKYKTRLCNYTFK